MSPATLALRAVLVYVYLSLLVRLSGRRGLRQTSPLDLVVALVLSSLTAGFARGEVSAAAAVAATGTMLALHLSAYWLSWRVPALGRLLGLRPLAGEPLASEEPPEEVEPRAERRVAP